MLAVKTFDLTKKYGKVIGIENVNLDIEAGEIFGLVGPDGAGKTTFVRLLLNYIFPTSGSAVIFGNDIVKEAKENKTSIAYIPAEVECYRNMKAGKFIKTSMKFHKTSPKSQEYSQLMSLFTIKKGERFEVMDRSDKKIVAIVAALVNEPQLAIFDEPAKDLDSSSKNRLFEYLVEKNQEGMTIILTAEREEDLQGICTHVAHIDGSIIHEAQQEINFIPEDNFDDEVELSADTIPFVPEEENDDINDSIFATSSPEEDDYNDSIFADVAATEDEEDEFSDSIFENAAPLEQFVSEEDQTVSQDDGVIPDNAEIPEINETEIPDETIKITTLKSLSQEDKDHFTAAMLRDRTPKSIKIKTTKFEPTDFEQIGAKIMQLENGKVSITYSGDLNQLVEVIRAMDLNDLSLGETLGERLKPLFDQSEDALEGSDAE